MTRAGSMAAQTMSKQDLELIDAYWRAANYLSVGEIYLLDNPLLREPLRAEHIKPRLLGQWGTTPGLHLLYAHMNHATLRHQMVDARLAARAYTREHGEDDPAIGNWGWPSASDRD